ncbi:MAG TPA: LmeA family phospholipid-binding protein [Solirubrobacteraceae bacterium]|jgi:hypothetical protein
MRRGGGGRGRRLALGAAGTLLLALALAQVLLPRIAAGTISSRVSRYGKVQSVSVSAWPAIELLWGSADSVRVRARRLALAPAAAAKLLWESHGVARMEVSAERVKLGPLALTGATLAKHGTRLSAAATASEAAVDGALPEGFAVRLLRSERGQVEVQAAGGLFGVGAAVDAVALARGGRLVAHPVGFLLEALQLTLFSDRHVYVEGVGAAQVRVRPASYRLTMSATLR